MSELGKLKSVLRSLVVSSPACVDARALMRDYRNMVGEALPAARYGYRDQVQFLRERCADCFLFSGPPNNPVLTPIVPESLRHIDDFVQKQKTNSKTTRFMGKRRSVQEPRRPEPPRQTNLVVETFNKPIQKPATNEATTKMSVPQEEPVKTTEVAARMKRPEAPVQRDEARPEVVPQLRKPQLVQARKPDVVPQSDAREGGARGEGGAQGEGDGLLQRLRARRARAGASTESLHDDDSGRHTDSSSSSRRGALERLNEDVAALVVTQPQGVWASQLPRLYQERYGRELNYSRLGFPSISACACALPALAATRAPDGDWLLRDARAPAPPTPPRPARRPAPRQPRLAPADPEDALPGIDYDPDVFPADCLSFAESIPGSSVAGIRPGDMLPLVVGEVYSPSHMWVLLLGPEYDQMEAFMDEMTEYYTKGEGAKRVLAAGARRPGQYCSSVWEGDWHRSLIVQVVDSDTVKVRHVDYGTVDTVAAGSLRGLRRAWGGLPARAVRARLAGLRPPAASRRWPRAAAAHCLRLLRDRRLVGNVVAVDPEENILELFLIDTTTAVDVNITDEMISAGHADPRPRPALQATESYLYPVFAALEDGATPNYAEIHALLRDGIALDYVEAYRRHVPALLPEPPAPRPAPPPAPAPPALVRVPLLWASTADLPAPEPNDCPPDSPDSLDLPDLTEDGEAAATPESEPEPAPAPAPAAEEIPPESIPEPAPAQPPAPPPPPAPLPAPAPPPISYTPRPLRPPPPRPAHPPAFYAVPQPCYHQAFFPGPFAPGGYRRPHPAQFYPAAPQWAAPPAPPQPAPPPPGEVRLSASECEVFELLSRVDLNAAHRYMTEQLRRARPAPLAPAPALNPLAPEFRFAAAPRPPPGFEGHAPRARRY